MSIDRIGALFERIQDKQDISSFEDKYELLPSENKIASQGDAPRRNVNIDVQNTVQDRSRDKKKRVIRIEAIITMFGPKLDRVGGKYEIVDRDDRETRVLYASAVTRSTSGYQKALYTTLEKLFAKEEFNYSVTAGFVVDIQFNISDASNRDLNRGRPVTDIEMFTGQYPEIHLLPGVDQDESKWNTMDDNCVINYLHHLFRGIAEKDPSSGCISFAHKTKGRQNIKNRFIKACGAENMGDGITVQNIIDFAKNLKWLSVHAYSIDGTLVASHVPTGSKRRSIAFYVSGNHFCPVTDEQVLHGLCARGTKHTAIEGCMEDEAHKTKTPPVYIDGDANNDINCIIALVGNMNESKVILTSHSLETVLESFVEQPRNLFPTAMKSFDTKLYELRFKKTRICYHPNPWECKRQADEFGIEFTGQTCGSLACQIYKNVMGADVPTCSYNKETLQIFDQVISPHTKLVVDKPKHDEIVQSFDVRKCYTTILTERKYEWPVFSCFDETEPFDGNLRVGEYHVNTTNIFPLKGSGWYPSSTVQQCIELGIISTHDITRQLVTRNTLKADHFAKFVEKCIEVAPYTYKAVVNNFIGCLASRTSFKLSPCHASKNESVILDIYHRNVSETVSPCVREVNGIFYTDILYERYKTENRIPFHRCIITQAWIECYKLSILLRPGRFLACNTDCVHIGTTKRITLENPRYREEDSKDPDWFEISDIVKQTPIERMDKSITYIDEPPRDTSNEWDDFRPHILSVLGKSLRIQGVPGAGKSHYISKFCQVLDEQKIKYICLSFTNCVAENLNGSTIHKGLGLTIKDCKLRNGTSKLSQYEYIIVDEDSMIPAKLWSRLHTIKRRFPDIKFLLVGDFDQVSPVECEGTPPRVDVIRTWAKAAIKRAKRRNLGECDLTVEFLLDLVDKCKGYSQAIHGCDDSGICRKRLVFELDKECDDTASIDRIDNKLGYTRGNVRLVTKRENNERGVLEIYNYKKDPDLLDYSFTRVVLELCDFTCMYMTHNRRSDPRMTDLLKDFQADREVNFKYSTELPKVNLAYTNAKCREVNSLVMSRENANFEPHQICFVKHTNDIWTQDMYLTVGTPLICRQGRGELVNGGLYTVTGHNNESIQVHNTRKNFTIDVALGEVQQLFLLAYCTTIHKRQGSTIREEYAIHQWEKLSKRQRYTAISRTDHIDKFWIYTKEVKQWKTIESQVQKQPIEPNDPKRADLIVDEFIRLYNFAESNNSRSYPILTHAKGPIHKHANEDYDSRCREMVSDMKKDRSTWVRRISREELSLNVLCDDLMILDLDTEDAVKFFETHISPYYPEVHKCPLQKTRKGFHYVFLRPADCMMFNKARAFRDENMRPVEIDLCTAASTGTRGNLNVYPSKNKYWIRSIYDHPPEVMSKELHQYLADRYIGIKSKAAQRTSGVIKSKVDSTSTMDQWTERIASLSCCHTSKISWASHTKGRLDVHPRKCLANPGMLHEHDNAFLTINEDNTLTYHCMSARCGRTAVIRLDPPDSDEVQ